MADDIATLVADGAGFIAHIADEALDLNDATVDITMAVDNVAGLPC